MMSHSSSQTYPDRNRRKWHPLGNVVKSASTKQTYFRFRMAWPIAVFLVIVQQGAFISLPFVFSDFSPGEMRVENALNTASIGISIALIILVCALHFRKLLFLLGHNWVSLIFLFLVLLSTFWSIHPDLTIRRAIGYVLTVLVACYLVVGFSSEQRLKVLSWAFAISGISSLLFAILFPKYGIMQFAELNGSWRGVFPHKYVLASVMAVAVFVEVYILSTGTKQKTWHFGLLALFFSLVVLARSNTALLSCALYISGGGLYLLWSRDRLVGAIVLLMGFFVLSIGVVTFLVDPDLIFEALGRDSSLTGRIPLWGVVTSYIEQRPWLGWGYRAMWVVGDSSTSYIDQVTGGWGASSSHNAYLEIALQLGVVGLIALIAIICIAFWRAIQCWKVGIVSLAWFSALLFVGVILSGLTGETLGQNQVIEWLVFNVLLFGCGISLTSGGRSRKNA